MKVEFLLITYFKELDMLKNLLSSLRFFLEEKETVVRVVIQGELVDGFDSIDTHGLNVVFESQSKYLDSCDSDNGWLIQQYLKLSAAKYCNSDYTIVLDCKHVFVRPFSVDEFFSGDKVVMPLGAQTMHVNTPRGDAFKNIASIYGVDWKVCMERTLPTVTPYVFVNKYVREMINYLEVKFRMPFYMFFFNQGFLVTEFYLYSLFLHKHDLIEDLYISDSRKDLIFWTEEDFREKSFLLRTSEVRSVAFHRRIVESGSDLMLNEINDYFSSVGLDSVCINS